MVEPEGKSDRVLILTPVKDAGAYLESYFRGLYSLDYPRENIALGLLESDSEDDTFAQLQAELPRLQRDFAKARIWKKDFGYRMPPGIPRWAVGHQLERRGIMARGRNQLLFRAMEAETDWVLWLDVDVVGYPPDLIQRLIAPGGDIVQPHCVLEPGGPTFDRNAWRNAGRLHLEDFRGVDGLVQLDTVGGTVLLVRADAHRDGLIFPAFPYGLGNEKIRQDNFWRGEIETEGLGIMAADMDLECWGIPDLEVYHYDDRDDSTKVPVAPAGNQDVLVMAGSFRGQGGFRRHSVAMSKALGAYLKVLEYDWQTLKDHPTGLVPTSRPLIGIGSVWDMVRMRGEPSIGFVTAETSRLPPECISLLEVTDHLWVPSHWCRKLLLENGIPGDRVAVVPCGVDTDVFRPLESPSRRDRFRFLAVGKWEERKGFEDLLTAFCSAFRPDEPVELYLHCHCPQTGLMRALPALMKVASEYRHMISLTDKVVDDESLRQLYGSSDAFVLPTRGEAWGHPILEAMACELPVIVTDNSAYLEFMNEEHGYLIDVGEMIPVSDPLHFQADLDWGVWARADLDHLRELLRHVYENPQEARERGRAGRRKSSELSWDRAARIALDHLQGIGVDLRFSAGG